MDDGLTDKIEDIIYDFTDGGAPSRAAEEIVSRLPDLLHQAGWMPPDKTERIFAGIHGWIDRTGRLPQDPGPGVLTSHLTELADIISDRQAHT